ncbi:MAG: tripartite tricarboxylate transporter substrate binding protein [Pseudomonadota bacterium]
MISRRPLLQALALSAIAVARPVFPQQYPARPIRFVVPASAGTTIDVTARFMAEAMGRALNVSIIVDNRAGAGAVIGTEYVAKSAPDGYTLLFTGIPLYLTKWLSEAPVSYDPVTDFAPISLLCNSPLGIVVPANSPYKTLSDLVRAMRAKPDEITFSSGGNGSAAHLCMVLLNDLTQTVSKHIPYKGNTPAVTDVAGGQVDFTCQGSGGIVPLIRAGKLRPLAVTNRSRWDFLPEVPTAIEAGVPNFEMTGWIGVVARAGTPAPIVQRLSDEFVRIARTPEFKEFCNKQQMFVDISDHKQFAADVPRYDATLKRLALLAKKG